MRQEFTKATKLAAFGRAQGRCELCTARLFPGNTEYHHRKECAFEGGATLENCAAICRTCHSSITGKRAAVIAKSNRVRNRHIGIRKPSQFQAARDKPWKKKISGEVVRR